MCIGSKLEPSDMLEDFPGISTVYLRLPWSYLEPEEGQFNWSVFDSIAQRWIDEGKKVDKSASSKEIIVNLKKGENKIRINNEFKQLPDFDKIQILNIKR